MSDRRPPFVLAAVVLAVSLGSAACVTVQADGGSGTDATAGVWLESATPTWIAADAALPLGRPFTLTVGETAVLDDGLEVRFVAVIADSRCPADVVCVWEGNAEIAIDLAVEDEDRTSLTLNTNPSFATVAAYLSYSVGLIGLEPYPRTDVGTGEPYRATLVAWLSPAHPTPAPSTSASAAAVVAS